MSKAWGDDFIKTCRPRSILTGSEWADEYRYVAPGTSPEPGPWRTDRVPYLREPMDSATDSDTEIIVMMFSSQVGKSEMQINLIGYYADQEPAPQLMLQPTVEAAEAFSKERIDPTFRYSPGLKGKLEDGKDGRGSSRKTATTIRQKHYPGGYLALVGANSPAGLASRPIRILLADEVDRYGTTKEGDPLKLAIQRTTNFHNRKIILVSTPTVSERSKIEEWFKKSDQRYYNVPCKCCGGMQVLKWAQVKWDRDDAGGHLPETARYECEHCGEVMRGAGKPDMDMLLAGRWVATRESKIKGYHLNSLYSPWVSLDALVAEWVEATKNRDRKGLMEFLNLKLGEPWVEHDDDMDYEHLHGKRREYYKAELPDGVLVVTAGVDVQDTYLAVETVGWGVGYESWGIEYRIIMGDPGQDAVWNQLDEYLQRTWAFASGTRMGIACACIDSGGHFTNEVYRFTKAREFRRIFAIKGQPGMGRPFVSKPVRNNRIGAVRFDLGVDSGKSTVMSRLRIEEEGPGYCHFPRDQDRGYDVEYFRGLLSERLVYKYQNGKSTVKWDQIYERNEPLDVRNYATGALEILNPNLEALAEHPDPGNVFTQAQPAARGRRRGVLSRGVT